MTVSYPLDEGAEYPLDPIECTHNWRQPANHDPGNGPIADPAAVSVCGSCGVQFDSMNERL